MSIKKWHFISEKAVFQTSIFEVAERKYTLPKNGKLENYYAIKSKSWVIVLAITDNNEAVLVKQFRAGSNNLSLELPGGIIDADETPLEAAKRELMEETGYSAKNWELLSTLRPNPALFDNFSYVFLANGAIHDGQTCFDPNEDLETLVTPLNQLEDLLKNGSIDHAVMVAGIALYLTVKRG